MSLPKFIYYLALWHLKIFEFIAIKCDINISCNREIDLGTKSGAEIF